MSPLSRLLWSLLVYTCPVTVTRVEASTRSPEAEHAQQLTRQALVLCSAPNLYTYGVLLGDPQTVVLPAPKKARGWYDIDWKTRCYKNNEWVEAKKLEVVRHDERTTSFLVVRLSKPLGGTPLPTMSDAPLAFLGQQVYATWGASRTRGGKYREGTEVMTTQITGVGPRYLSVGASLDPGTVVFDSSGRVLALVDARGKLKRQSKLRTQEHPGTKRLNQVAIRFGADAQGPSGEEAAIVELEVAGSISERWSTHTSIGYVGALKPSLVALEPIEGGGPGVVSTQRRGLTTSFELRRQGLKLMFVSLDLALGARGRIYQQSTRGPALYSNSPGCDPLGDACTLTAREPNVPSKAPDDGWVYGPVVGADARVLFLTMGVRYQPGFLTKGSNTDIVTVLGGFRIAEF